eukprot:GHVU01004753.1.p2 GENE.GHVU01004753.1~~GHVU01004753.1.p2  ORF type:complete len:100 (-),score=8.26 GHVU01004753.1:203-502(-)
MSLTLTQMHSLSGGALLASEGVSEGATDCGVGLQRLRRGAAETRTAFPSPPYPVHQGAHRHALGAAIHRSAQLLPNCSRLRRSRTPDASRQHPNVSLSR